MSICALRGAITVEENSPEDILKATREMLRDLIVKNDLEAKNIISAWFTATPDLDRAYPAAAARELGWERAALLCVQEMPVEGSLQMCVRVLILHDTERTQSDMRHSYLRGAAVLRPDLVE